jgi:RimJ/RimL family protein N-acetyltransferase
VSVTESGEGVSTQFKLTRFRQAALKNAQKTCLRRLSHRQVAMTPKRLFVSLSPRALPDVRLREMTAEDMAFINAWRHDPEVIGQLGCPFRYISQDVDWSWFQHYVAHRHENVRLMIDLPSPCGQIMTVGQVNLTMLHAIHRTAEFSIVIPDVAFRGRGIGREATRQVLNHGFFDLNLNRIELTVLADNQAARALYESLGFVAEGQKRQALFKAGRYVDVILMGLLRDDWYL